MQLLPSWYAVQVKCRQEHISAEYLKGKGYEVLLPTYLARSRYQNVAEHVLFPGYLFCRVCYGVVAKIVTTPGVVRVLGYGKTPAPVAEHEMEAVQQLISSTLRRSPFGFFSAGDRVRIASGPLNGVEGVLVTDTDGRKLIMSISLLNRSVAAYLPQDTQLEPIFNLKRAPRTSTALVAEGPLSAPAA